MQETDLDTRPRTVRFRRGVPGRAMMRVLDSRKRLTSGQNLGELYQDEPHVACYSAALALHLLPRHGVSKRTRYSAVISDIGDFLRFRFRAKVPSGFGMERTRETEPITEGTDGELVIHIIKSLESLSLQFREESKDIMELLSSVLLLKEMLKIAARRVFPGDPDEYAKYEAMFAEPQQQSSLT